MCVDFYRNISQMTDREDMSTHTVLEDIDFTGVLNYNWQNALKPSIPLG